MDRYIKNGIFTKVEMEKVKNSKVCVLGCGGLGGYVIEMLARVGVGSLTVVDGDTFDPSNLNRQLLSIERNLGSSKAFEAKERVNEINSNIQVNSVQHFIEKENMHAILKGHDVIVDALDSIPIRIEVQNVCETLGIALVHGAIAGWYGQVTTVFPGDKTLDRMYESSQTKGVETKLGNPSFTPAQIASVEVSEALKIITGKGKLFRNKILYIDLLNNEFEVMHI